MFLYLKTFWHLLRFQYYIRSGDFALLHQKVREYPCSAEQSRRLIEHLCPAIDVACIWYPKTVLCLQRSAATTCVLRNFGLPAQMIIGVQKLPFNAHAWVEVSGNVVNDKPYMREIYAEIDRC
jgi:prolyl oligopeptidase